MRGTSVAALWCTLAVIGAAFSSGCTTSPYRTDRPLSLDYYVSRDSVLHYRVPFGWFDATRVDEPNRENAVWLVRSDYAATISMSEVNIDSEARAEVRRQGLLGLARLTVGLVAGEKSTILLRPPAVFSVGGNEFCSYELTNLSTSDSIRVVLLETGEKVYELTAIVIGGGRRTTTNEVYSVQQTFLEHLKW